MGSKVESFLGGTPTAISDFVANGVMAQRMVLLPFGTKRVKRFSKEAFSPALKMRFGLGGMTTVAKSSSLSGKTGFETVVPIAGGPTAKN